MSKLRVLDLFSGIGGFSLGLERTGGFETVAFCEIEPFARSILNKHWPEVPCYDDVRKLNADRLHADGVGVVDVICGGFPCQDISDAGFREGIEGERSGLWSEIARLTCELRPKFIIVENVSALLGRGLDRVLGDLAEIRYDAEWHCIPASYVGSPQLRDRIWIVAYPEGCPPWVAIPGNRSRKAQEGRANEASPIGRRIGMLRVDRWHPEPPVGRVVDGVSPWVDEVSKLGNAVVPQIPELIGRAILASEASA